MFIKPHGDQTKAMYSKVVYFYTQKQPLGMVSLLIKKISKKNVAPTLSVV